MNEKDADQKRRFIEAAREAGADMTKQEFARVIGGPAKPKPQAAPQEADAGEDQADDE